MNNVKNGCACRGRNLDKMLQPGILAALYDNKLHGFMLIQQIGKNPMFSGSDPDKAGVYRYLKKMEAEGLLKSEWQLDDSNNNPRRVYSITDSGKRCLISWLDTLTNYNKALSKMIIEIENAVTER